MWKLPFLVNCFKSAILFQLKVVIIEQDWSSDTNLFCTWLKLFWLKQYFILIKSQLSVNRFFSLKNILNLYLALLSYIPTNIFKMLRACSENIHFHCSGKYIKPRHDENEKGGDASRSSSIKLTISNASLKHLWT